MTDDRPVPEGLDRASPNISRMYDYFLGGKDNFAVDRDAAEKVLSVAPSTPALALENRAFLGRAVRFLARNGVRQFIDIGSGLPTQYNVHQVAQEVAADSRVVYVDYDPVVFTHSQALLATNERTVAIKADMRRPADILGRPEFTDVIDLDRPVAVLFISVLHCLTDEDRPDEIVSYFRDRMTRGSYVVISHITALDNTEMAERGAQIYSQVAATTPMTLRSRDQILALFDGFDLVDPGLVPLPDWRTETVSEAVTPLRRPGCAALPTHYLCGVGCKQR